LTRLLQSFVITRLSGQNLSADEERLSSSIVSLADKHTKVCPLMINWLIFSSTHHSNFGFCLESFRSCARLLFAVTELSD
jgi:hypothetical protein